MTAVGESMVFDMAPPGDMQHALRWTNEGDRDGSIGAACKL